MQLTDSPHASAGAVFPYGLDNLLYWVIKRKDGSVVKFLMDKGEGIPRDHPTSKTTALVKSAATSAAVFSAREWCHHYPTHPVYVDDQVSLFIADDIGVLRDGPKFDLVIDCGGVVKFSNTKFFKESIFSGDVKFARKFAAFQIMESVYPRVLKIEWWDRCAPDLKPEFWPALAKELRGNVVINCQGGHGRSGTAIVCLLMSMIPSYTPLDAFVHLRAVHCPRAIESKAQHDYINFVGASLGRTPNMPSITAINSYKEAFENSSNEDAQRLIIELAEWSW